LRRLPAEWEKHFATFTTYPQNPETFFDHLEQAKDIFVQMVKLISEEEKVFINVDDEEQKKDLIKRLEKFKVDPKNITINIIPTNDAWHRDYGAFVVEEDGKPLSVKFRFNSWGEKYPYELDDKAGEKMCEILKYSCEKVNMVLEGGSIDTNGEGVFLTTESCLLNKNRNPGMSKKEIEEALQKHLGAKKFIWLKDGIVGDDTDGHIDDITRFIGKSTIITAIEEDKGDENYYPLMENYEILKQTGFDIKTLPMPEPQFYDYPDHKNYRLPASYANFYITNKYVIVPTFNCPQDKVAIETLQKLFVDLLTKKL